MFVLCAHVSQVRCFSFAGFPLGISKILAGSRAGILCLQKMPAEKLTRKVSFACTARKYSPTTALLVPSCTICVLATTLLLVVAWNRRQPSSSMMPEKQQTVLHFQRTGKQQIVLHFQRTGKQPYLGMPATFVPCEHVFSKAETSFLKSEVP